MLARLGVKVAAVSIDTKPADTVAAYLRKVGAVQLQAFHDPDGAVLAAARADGTSSPFQRWRMPLTFAVDPGGRVRGYMPGRVDWLSPEGTAFLKALSA